MEKQNVIVSLPLVYVLNGQIVRRPDFEAANKDSLVGILIDKTIVALKEQVVSWSLAHWIARGKRLHCGEAVVPSLVVMQNIRQNLENFNAIIKLLQQNGIAADRLNLSGVYWLNEEFSHRKAFAFLMKEQLPTLLDKFDEKSGTLRMVWNID